MLVWGPGGLGHTVTGLLSLAGSLLEAVRHRVVIQQEGAGTPLFSGAVSPGGSASILTCPFLSCPHLPLSPQPGLTLWSRFLDLLSPSLASLSCLRDERLGLPFQL